MLRIRTFLFGTVLLCFTVLPLYGLDLIRELDWKDNGNLKVERKEDGGGCVWSSLFRKRKNR